MLSERVTRWLDVSRAVLLVAIGIIGISIAFLFEGKPYVVSQVCRIVSFEGSTSMTVDYRFAADLPGIDDGGEILSVSGSADIGVVHTGIQANSEVTASAMGDEQVNETATYDLVVLVNRTESSHLPECDDCPEFWSRVIKDDLPGICTGDASFSAEVREDVHIVRISAGDEGGMWNVVLSGPVIMWVLLKVCALVNEHSKAWFKKTKTWRHKLMVFTTLTWLPGYLLLPFMTMEDLPYSPEHVVLHLNVGHNTFLAMMTPLTILLMIWTGVENLRAETQYENTWRCWCWQLSPCACQILPTCLALGLVFAAGKLELVLVWSFHWALHWPALHFQATLVVFRVLSVVLFLVDMISAFNKIVNDY